MFLKEFNHFGWPAKVFNRNWYILFMKGFLNEPFVDRIFGFSTNPTTMLDLDQKRRLVEIFFEFNKSPIKTRKSSKKSRDKLENQLAVWQYIPELKCLSFLSVGVPKSPSLRWSLTYNPRWAHSKNRVWDYSPEPRQRTVWPGIWELSHSSAICTIH